MVKQKGMDAEKEKAVKLKALRNELEERLEEQLPPEMLEGRTKVEVQQIDEGCVQDPAQAKGVIEALLFATNKPLTINEIRKVLKSLAPGDIKKLIMELKEEFSSEARSFELIEIAGGFEFATKRKFAPWILKVELQKKARQVTQSALETLAILAYKQPVTRAEVEELRGVDVGGVMSTLTERGLARIVGKKEVPGRPFLYGTTDKFLEHFGLKSLKDLPNIEEIHTLVETSVKRDELLGTTNVVDVPAEEAAAEQATDENDEDLRKESV